MKRDLLIGGFFILLAALGLGGVLLFTAWANDSTEPQTIPPKTEPIAEFNKNAAEPAKTERVKIVVIEKKPEPEPKKIEEPPKVLPKTAPEPPPAKVEPKIELKKEEKRPDPPLEKKQPAVKAIVLGNVTKLSDPDGEYVVKTMQGGQEITLLGKIKKLVIQGVNERSLVDATRLDADEIVLAGDINSGSKVLLGKARTLKIRSINDQSLLDASDLNAQNVVLTGAVNSRSTLKVHAPKGSVEIAGEINDQAKIEIIAPGGNGDAAVNGGAQLRIVAQSLELRGAVNGPQTFIHLILSKSGSLQFRRLSGGVRLHYSKANASDPAVRVDRGQVDARGRPARLPSGENNRVHMTVLADPHSNRTTGDTGKRPEKRGAGDHREPSVLAALPQLLSLLTLLVFPRVPRGSDSGGYGREVS